METAFTLYHYAFYTCVFLCVLLELYTFIFTQKVSIAELSYVGVAAKNKVWTESAIDKRSKLIMQMYKFYTFVMLFGLFTPNNANKFLFLMLLVFGHVKFLLPKAVRHNVWFARIDALACAAVMAFTILNYFK